MELKFKRWEDVSINNYKRIVEITKDETSSVMEKNLSTLAVLCDIPEEKIWDLPVTEVKGMLSQLGWLDKFDFNRNFNTRKIKLGGDEFTIEPDLQKMTISQYIDFQTFWGKKDRDNYMGLILACFIVPKGHKYAEGYDVIELAKRFEEELSICTYNEVVFFSLRDWLNSIEATIIYCNWILRKMEKKNRKDPEVKRMLEAKIEEMKKATTDMVGWQW